MKNKLILQRAIQKAIDGGWSISGGWLKDKSPAQIVEAIQVESVSLSAYKQLIFDHNFAKALWGEEDSDRWKIPSGATVIAMKHWQVMLQQMVIADDPIKYLGENI